MRAVVPDVICEVLAFLVITFDAATDRGLAVIVLAEILRIGENSLEELEGYDLLTIVVHLVDAGHTDILDHAEMSEIFLTEGHPEAGALDGRIVLDERLKFLVVEEVALTFTDIGISEGLVDLERFGGDLLAILIVTSVLSDLADVDLGIEVGGESFSMITAVAIDDVEILHVREVMLGSIGGEDTRYTRIETTTKDSSETCVLEAFLISPLPGVFEMSHILGLIVGGVEIVDSADQAGIHNGEILIGEGDIDHE